MAKRSKRYIQIAIDGPVAAGKSTVAKRLADELGLLYVDTGAMYRAVALLAKRHGVSRYDEEALVELMAQHIITLEKPEGARKDGRNVTVLLDNEDVSWEIRTQEMGEGASVIGQLAKVRQQLVKRQQTLAEDQGVVMEGRDIAVRVLPRANLKIFMTADEEQRVTWKWQALRAMGERVPREEVKKALVTRDERERTRKIDPLRPVAEAWILDTTDKSIDDVVRLITLKLDASQV